MKDFLAQSPQVDKETVAAKQRSWFKALFASGVPFVEESRLPKTIGECLAESVNQMVDSRDMAHMLLHLTQGYWE